ncbi:hypothetical protein ABT324_00690 [Saccharopolyspora sp. NPDC000359]|uniref:hypothetical protein n=1 Tax=Saccharopolyspora sp. NPDC000359 TaxID=3154251 RepID=UPI003321A005
MTHSPMHEDCQTFRFGTWQWCVDTAEELIRDDPSAATLVAEGDISGLGKLLPFHPDPPGVVPLIRVHVDIDYAMTTDLSKPIIAARLVSEAGEDCGVVVVDGWHRVFRALWEGRVHLPTYLLSNETERACRIPIFI